MRASAEKTAIADVGASRGDADPDHPHGTALIPWQDGPHANRILWSCLSKGRAAVIVGTEGMEMLIEPVPASLLARLGSKLRQRIAVEVSCVSKDVPRPINASPVRLDVGRHALMRPPAAGA